MSQANLIKFQQLLASDPHLAERARTIPSSADAETRLIELAASVGLPFTLREWRAAETEQPEAVGGLARLIRPPRG